MVSKQVPPAGRGAYITAVAPGGPAELAGLRPGHTILSVNGQTINAPQTLLDIVTGSHAGDYLQIAYNDGSRMQWTRAQLVPRSQLSPPAQGLPPAAGSLLGGITAPGATPPQNMPPVLPVVSYNVMHDHGQSGQNFCSGILAVGGGRVAYRGNNAAHIFDFGVDEIKEAKKNGVYLVAVGAFHIRLKSGPNYNFVVLGQGGQHQSPDEVLRAIGLSMGGSQ
jgi:membrane-associated protease RseP (regulator of RpoE activity)